MGYVESKDRQQFMYLSLEDLLPEESIVRVIDRFIDILNFEELGFTNTEPSKIGRPSYPPKELAKLHLYGYENGIRSSRKLERETYRNVEVMWLMNEMKPDHKTIANFRKNNIRPIQKLFREFVQMCKDWSLIGGELIAVDGTKIKASNNKKKNFSRKKLDARLKRIDDQINAYLNEIENNDKKENDDNIDVKQLLEDLSARKAQYEGYLKELDETGNNEISVVDPDARLMGNNRGGVDVCYNVQSAVDGKNDIIVNYDVSLNPADHGHLGIMVKMVRNTLGIKRFISLADKGYYNGRDLSRCKKYKITTIVPRQKTSNPKNQPKEFHTESFVYNENDDTYTCFYGETLHCHSKKTTERWKYFNKTACKSCPYREACASGGKYRTVSRSKYNKIYEEVNKRTAENMALYKRRQMIVEHPFGTIKYTLGGYHFLLRTRRKVRAEVAMLFFAYNLKRAYKILGFREIMARLDSLVFSFFHLYRKLWCNSANVSYLTV